MGEHKYKTGLLRFDSDGDEVELPVEVFFDYIAAERASWHCPGCVEEVDISRVMVGALDIPLYLSRSELEGLRKKVLAHIAEERRESELELAAG